MNTVDKLKGFYKNPNLEKYNNLKKDIKRLNEDSKTLKELLKYIHFDRQSLTLVKTKAELIDLEKVSKNLKDKIMLDLSREFIDNGK